MKRTAWPVTVFVVLATMVAMAQPSVRSNMLVSTQWLAEHSSDRDVVVLQVSETEAMFRKQHIPGARYIAYDAFMDEHVGATAELPSADRLKKAFENLGISDKTRVVIYSTDWMPYAARVWFTLDSIGHGDHAALLDGGFEQWKSEKRPVASGVAQPVRRGKLTVKARPESVYRMEQVKSLAGTSEGNTVLLDSRPASRYKDGHIAGATNIYWKETIVSDASPVFQSPEKLRELFVQRGIKANAKPVTYCEIGIQASHNYFVAKYLGYDAAVYDGSFYEWNRLEEQPVVKGETPR